MVAPDDHPAREMNELQAQASPTACAGNARATMKISRLIHVSARPHRRDDVHGICFAGDIRHAPSILSVAIDYNTMGRK